MKKDRMLYDTSEALYKSSQEEADCLQMVALYVMAPIMVEYITWVLKNAVKNGHTRLYFLARDGYSMYRVAEVLCSKWKLPVECRYLYASRYALRSAEYFLLGTKALEYICLGGIDVTFQKLMYRAGLNREEAKKIAVLLHREDTMENILSYRQIKEIQPQLAQCSTFLKLMSEHSQRAYPNAIEYLKQEGLFENKPYALVDSGWTGSMQKCLNRLLDSQGMKRQMEGYYFGMYEYPADVCEKTYHTFYFAPKVQIERKVYFSNSLFECIFSSPEGMTMAYRRMGARMVPVFEKPVNPNHAKLERTTKYLCRYAGYLADKYPQERKTDETVIEELLKCFMGFPTREEAEEFGSYVFCDDVLGEETQTVAALLKRKDIRKNFPFRKAGSYFLKLKSPIRESAWMEGTIVLEDEEWDSAQRQNRIGKYLRYLRQVRK